MNLNRPMIKTTQTVSNISLPLLSASDGDILLGSAPGLSCWLDPIGIRQSGSNYIWRDRVNGNEWDSSGSAGGAITMGSKNGFPIVTVNGSAMLRPVAENTFKMNETEFTLIAAIRGTEDDLTTLVGPTYDPADSSPLAFNYGVGISDKQRLIGQAAGTGVASTRATSNDTGYDNVWAVVGVTFSVERGINFIRNGTLVGSSNTADRAPLGPDTDDTLKIQLFAEGFAGGAGTPGSRFVGGTATIMLFSRDYGSPRYAPTLLAVCQELMTRYDISA